VEKDDAVPLNNIRNTAKWRIREETLQHAVEAGRKGPGEEMPKRQVKIPNSELDAARAQARNPIGRKRGDPRSVDTPNLSTPHSSEVTTRVVDKRAWRVAKTKALKIALDNLELVWSDRLKAGNMPKLNSLASKLLVVSHDEGVIVCNNPEHATRMKELEERKPQQ
jgi:hypothetical protein